MIYLAFIFGLFFGSFLNVIIYRLKNDRNIIFGRSFCPSCKHQLRWHDLVPILSFLYLRGRCHYCSRKISWQYPIVEFMSGLLWVSVFYKSCFYINFSPFGRCPEGTQFLNFLNFFYYIFIFSTFLIIAVYDFKWRIIPNKIVYPAIAVALIFNLFNTFKSGNLEISKFLNLEIFIFQLFTALIAFLFFFLIFYFSSGKAMGLGDAKLAFLIGLFLSPLLTAIALILAFIIGALFGILLIVFQKKSWKSQIAFGPFLILGVFITFFFSDFILQLLNL